MADDLGIAHRPTRCVHSDKGSLGLNSEVLRLDLMASTTARRSRSAVRSLRWPTRATLDLISELPLSQRRLSTERILSRALLRSSPVRAEVTRPATADVDSCGS